MLPIQRKIGNVLKIGQSLPDQVNWHIIIKKAFCCSVSYFHISSSCCCTHLKCYWNAQKYIEKVFSIEHNFIIQNILFILFKLYLCDMRARKSLFFAGLSSIWPIRKWKCFYNCCQFHLYFPSSTDNLLCKLIWQLSYEDVWAIHHNLTLYWT